MRPHFVILTSSGYVGRQALAGELRDDMPEAFAYTYDTREDAQRVASAFVDAVVVER